MISLVGLRELFKERKKGKRLPDGWIEQAKWYLKHKKGWVAAYPDDWNRVVLREAEALFRALVAW